MVMMTIVATEAKAVKWFVYLHDGVANRYPLATNGLSIRTAMGAVIHRPLSTKSAASNYCPERGWCFTTPSSSWMTMSSLCLT